MSSVWSSFGVEVGARDAARAVAPHGAHRLWSTALVLAWVATSACTRVVVFSELPDDSAAPDTVDDSGAAADSGGNGLVGAEMPSAVVRAGHEAQVETASADGYWSALRFREISAGEYQSVGVIQSDGSMVSWPFLHEVGGPLAVAVTYIDYCWIGEDRKPGCLWSVAPQNELIALDIRDYCACAVKLTGELTCWGSDKNQYGLLDPPAGYFTAVTTGSYFACALDMTGTPTCWSNKKYTSTITPPDGVAFARIDAGSSAVCGIDLDGGIHCWGDSGSAALLSPPGGRFIDVSLGDKTACAVTVDFEVLCWGDLAMAGRPTEGSFRQVSVGHNHACALDMDGYAYCFGRSTEEVMKPP